MEKRYQVFVSSTFADLQHERQRVIQTIMELDCVPAGMELFPAADEAQWDFIKRVIDDCDYYILIVGGRYGSLTSDGISYTEKEYDYAISRGLKVLGFLHEKPEEIPVGKSDIDPQLRAKLSAFREKASGNRLVKFWRAASDLPGLVALSLSKTIKTYPAVGWVRADQVANNEVLSDLNKLRKEKAALQLELDHVRTQLPNEKDMNLASLDDEFEVHIKWQVMGTRGYRDERATAQLSWAKIFSMIAPDLEEHPTDYAVNRMLGSAVLRSINSELGKSANVDHDDFTTIRIQFSTLGLVDTRYSKTTTNTMAFFWSLTDKGSRLMVKLRSVKAKPSSEKR